MNIKKIFNNETAEKVIPLEKVYPDGGDAAELAIALVSGSITVKARLADETAQSVGYIKAADYTTASGTISTAGIYIIPAEAFKEIVLTGTSATAYIKYVS